jgi:preprotein translocase subunit YajC
LELCVVPASVQLLVIVVAMLAFWAIVMRPARNQQKRVQKLQSELEVGQEVVLSAGIFGTVRALTEGRVEIEVAPGTVLTVARQVVVRRVEELEDAGPASTRDGDPDTLEPPPPPDPDKAED